MHEVYVLVEQMPIMDNGHEVMFKPCLVLAKVLWVIFFITQFSDHGRDKISVCLLEIRQLDINLIQNDLFLFIQNEVNIDELETSSKHRKKRFFFVQLGAFV